MATNSFSSHNRNEILAKLDAERQRRREYVIAGKTSPFRTSPVSEWEKKDNLDDLETTKSIGNSGTRELLVLKLLEERRRNAARLQQQLHENENENGENDFNDNNNNNFNGDEYENGSDTQNEYENEEFENEEELEYSSYGKNNQQQLFRPVTTHNYNSVVNHNDMTTEDLDYNAPTTTSSSYSSQPPPLPPHHPTRSQNLKFLKQHLQQQPPQHTESDSKRQMDLNAFDSAFQKIQENVYGRSNSKPSLDSKGFNDKGNWKGTISFGSDLDNFSAQLNNLNPPSVSSSTSPSSSIPTSPIQPPTSLPISRSSSTSSFISNPPTNNNFVPTASAPYDYFQNISFKPPPLTSAKTKKETETAIPRRRATSVPKNTNTRVSFSDKAARHGVERVSAEVDREFKAKHTFAPKREKKEEKKDDTRIERGKKVVITKERVNELAKSKKDKIKKLEAQKEALQREEIAKLPFKPFVNPLPLEYGNMRPQDDVPLVDRLYHEADKKIALRAKAKNELQIEQERSCTFRPKIGKPPSPVPESGVLPKPIYERLGEVQRHRREKLHNLKVQVEEEQKPTFKPKIVESRRQSRGEVHSEGEDEGDDSDLEEEKMTRSTNAPKQKEKQYSDIYSRLSNMEIEREKKFKKQEKWQKILADQYTFAPQVNANTEKILLESDAFGTNLDFLDRLNIYKDKRKCAMMQVEPPKYTFQPYVNPSSKGAETRETEEEKYERLAFGDREKQAIAKQQLEEEVYGKYTYKPSIDKISAYIAPQKTVEELYRDEQKERNKRAAKKAADDAFKTAYTFQPQLYSNPYDHVEPKHRVDIRDTDSISRKIKEMEERKAMKIQQERMRQEKKEMAQCTFTPVVNKNTKERENTTTINNDPPVMVRGLDRFLELKDLAKRLDNDKKSRAENAFKVKSAAVGGQPAQLPFTIPAPFHFHTRDRYAEEVKQKKMDKVNREMKMNEERELTFQPRTNARQKAFLIDEILSR